MEGYSLTDLRKKNYSDIYRIIYQAKQLSKSQIANALQMSLPTVTQHLLALTNDGMIEKRGLLASTIGRKAAAYAICPTLRVSVGVELLQSTVTVVVLDLYGSVIGKERKALEFSQQDAYFAALAQTINALLEAHQIKQEQVLGCGIGLQCLTSEDGQEILYGKVLGCTDLKIDPLQKQLPFPCCFVHDSACAAALELWRSPEITDALYISLGIHLGGAMIADGKIKPGRNGTFEHMTLVDGGRTCYCGKQGCMECYCSAGALLTDNETLEQFFADLRKGNPQANARWTDYLHWLAMAINNLHMVVDSPIFLGGHIAPYLLQNDLDILFAQAQQRTAFPEKDNFLSIGVQEPDVVALGAAVPFLSDFLASI